MKEHHLKGWKIEERGSNQEWWELLKKPPCCKNGKQWWIRRLFKMQIGGQGQWHGWHRIWQWKQKLYCQYQAQQPNVLYPHHLQISFCYCLHNSSRNLCFHLRNRTWISRIRRRKMTSCLPLLSLLFSSSSSSSTFSLMMISNSQQSQTQSLDTLHVKLSLGLVGSTME